MKLFLTFAFLSYSVVSFSRTIYLVEFTASTPQERSVIGNFIHLDGMNRDSVFSLISKADLHTIQENIPFLLDAVTEINIPEPKINVEEYPEGDEDYHTYEEMKSKIFELEKNYPEFVRVFSLGKSIEGRDIYTIEISDQSNSSTMPGILFTGSHHAREHLSTEVPLRIAERIINTIPNDESIKNLIKERKIYFVPMVNPDGAMHDIRGRSYKIWRKNMRHSNGYTYGVDLNRNYSTGFGGPGSSDRPASDIYHGDEPFSEPETRAIKDFIEENKNINIVLSFHSFSELILYPWGNTKEPLEDVEAKNAFIHMAQKMSKWNNYRPMQASELYVASGDTCDWAWDEHKIFCFTFELSPKYQWGPGGFYPGAKAIEPAVDSNYKPVIYLIEQAKDPYQKS